MSHPDDYDLNVPKKWVSRKNDQPEQTLTSTHHPMVGIDVGDVPESEKCKVLDSISRALAEQLRPMIDESFDSIPTWPSVKTPKDHKGELHPEAEKRLKKKLLDQVMKERGGERLDRVIQNATTPSKNRWIREIWILNNWFTFQNGDEIEMRIRFDEIGLAYLTDETAAAYISEMFDLSFTKKQFEDFRKEHGLQQVPQVCRRAGVMVNGFLKIVRIGRKKV